MRRWLFLFLLAPSIAAGAPGPALTEGEALRLGLGRPEIGERARAAIGQAQAEAVEASTRPNPTLEYSRERLRATAGASVEQTWVLSQTFDVSGRRALHREAGDRRVKAAVAGTDARRVELAAEIRSLFYQVLRQQERVRAISVWAQRFGRIDALVARLEQGGEVSGYDRRRLARERLAAEARLDAERADLDRAVERLAAAIGQPGSTGSVTGVLLPRRLPPLEIALARLDARPDLQELAHQAAAAEAQGRAAGLGWLPDVTVGAGPKRVEDSGRSDDGLIVTLSVPLPVFDRQQGKALRAAAEASAARADHRLALTHAEGELRGLHRQIDRLVSAAAQYRAQAVDASADLTRIAEAAYQGGESTLLELLDAYRGALDAETNALDLEWKARDAQIEYDKLIGSIE